MLGSACWADTLIVDGPTSGALDADALYLITYKCKPAGNAKLTMPGPGDLIIPEDMDDIFDPFGGGGRSVTHGFFLTKGAPTQALGVAEFNTTTKGIGADLVFISDGIADDGGATQDVDNRNCGGNYIVRGTDDATLTGFLIQAKAAQTKKLAATVNLITAAASPLVNLLTGAALQMPGLGQIQSLGTLSTEFQKFLGAFNESKATQKSLKLVPGKFVVQTAETTVTVRVTEMVDGLLRTSGSLFKVGINDLVDNFQLGTITADDLKKEDDGTVTKCRSVRNAWASRGINDRVDLAYVLWRSAAEAGPTKMQFVRCLGRDLAIAAAPYLGEFDLPTSELVFTEAEIDGLLAASTTSNAEFGEQPTDSGLDDRAQIIADGFSRLTGKGLAEDDLAEFSAYFAGAVKFKDSSDGYVLAQKMVPEYPKKTSVSGSIDVIAAHLKAQKVRIANCALVAKATFQSTSKESVILLATRPPASADEPSLLEIRLIHGPDGKVAELRITSDLTLDEVKGDCPAIDKVKIVTASTSG